MKTVNPYVKQYQKNEVETASPEKILILLFDGAIQFLNKAKIAIEENDIEKIHNNIVACERIIIEFMETLDVKNGGSIAEELYKLYDYMYRTLVSANLRKDIAKIDEVLKHLKMLRETWQKAINIANSENQKNQSNEDLFETSSYDKDEDDEDDEEDE